MADLTNYGKGLNTYSLITDEVVAGASKLFLDLFNAGNSDTRILLLGWYIIPKSDVAVTGAVSARFDLYRTNTVGTGGTTIGYKSPNPALSTISPRDTRMPAIPTGITARTAPTGGATITEYITKVFSFTEETNAALTTTALMNVLDDPDEDTPPLVINPGEGILIKQGSVATLNSFSHKLVFAVITDYL